MEKVGPLRQSGAAEAGKTYWVLFSNRGRVVHDGDRVSVVIGSFRVDGLVVQKIAAEAIGVIHVRNAVIPLLAVPLALVLAPALAHGADKPAGVAKLSAAAIVERNITARGGQSAWHAVQTLSWAGKMEAGGNNQRYLKAPGMPAPPVNPEPAAQVQLPFHARNENAVTRCGSICSSMVRRRCRSTTARRVGKYVPF